MGILDNGFWVSGTLQNTYYEHYGQWSARIAWDMQNCHPCYTPNASEKLPAQDRHTAGAMASCSQRKVSIRTRLEGWSTFPCLTCFFHVNQ